MLVMRIEGNEKGRVREAATLRGLSMTTFVRNAALREAERVINSARRRGHARSFRGVPTFFKALCTEAQRGGSNGYWNAAHELTRHLESLLSENYEKDSESEKRLDVLRHALGEARFILDLEPDELRTVLDDASSVEAVDAVWGWFKEECPRCMALVPTRRKLAFVQGVLAAYDKGITGF